mmetsp:Transcript_32319/g.74446  ORF Transcript_32319/g.74446 Transcript_32319/m.74446 type:complete len:379 (-) Transcript_32319:370-1506(-)
MLYECATLFDILARLQPSTETTMLENTKIASTLSFLVLVQLFIIATFLHRNDFGQKAPFHPPIIKDNIHNERQILSFLRISKTGSTSLFNFLEEQKSMHLLWYLWNKKKPRKYLGKCLFEHTNHPPDYDISRQNDIYAPSCFHSYYEDMVKEVTKLTTEYLLPLPETNYSETFNFRNDTVTLKIKWLSMVRDPYDRLKSLFVYSKDDYLDHEYTDKQIEYIEIDDFEGWMNSLREPRHHYIANQYMRFNYTSINGAKSLIKGEDPTIYTLIQECFQASLRLLVENFWIFENKEAGDVVEQFVNSKNFRSRTTNVKDGGLFLNHLDNDRLRSKAKEWFHYDFEFYHQAVRQFQLRMMASVERSGGDTTHFESCQYFTPE